MHGFGFTDPPRVVVRSPRGGGVYASIDGARARTPGRSTRDGVRWISAASGVQGQKLCYGAAAYPVRDPDVSQPDTWRYRHARSPRSGGRRAAGHGP
ncbi:hypothetical protein GCM10010123_42120 [Pilimelia anulata]|uniref:Uncharacterized protein n=1 Tax=Pilimelia anulata TaxID=53371 RepID=A0A8J3FCZ8_9ACTN|nr:hypothetical protein GCM10010123_42120 [Pilimelia anulata]